MQASKSELIDSKKSARSPDRKTLQETTPLASGIVSVPCAVPQPNDNNSSLSEIDSSEISPVNVLTSSLFCPGCESSIPSLLPSVFHLLSKLKRSSSDVAIYLTSIENYGLKNANWMADGFDWQVGELRTLFDNYAKENPENPEGP